MNKHITIEEQLKHLKMMKNCKIADEELEEVTKFLNANPYEYTIQNIKQLYRNKKDSKSYKNTQWNEYMDSYANIKETSFQLLDELLKVESYLKAQLIYYYASETEEKRSVIDEFLFNGNYIEKDREIKKTIIGNEKRNFIFILIVKHLGPLLIIFYKLEFMTKLGLMKKFST